MARLEQIIETQREPTEDMVRRFKARTARHIALVGRSIQRLAAHVEFGPELLERAEVHDASKFVEPERTPYIWITEYYRYKNRGITFLYPPGVEEATEQASLHHVRNNRHHPEFHEHLDDMTEVDLAEMVCDWHAMSVELGDSLRGWADANVGHRWHFSPQQVKLIYTMIDILES